MSSITVQPITTKLYERLKCLEELHNKNIKEINDEIKDINLSIEALKDENDIQTENITEIYKKIQDVEYKIGNTDIDKDTLTEAIADNNIKINEMRIQLELLPDLIIKKLYPVGSIYTAYINSDPSTIFGFGKWELIKTIHEDIDNNNNLIISTLYLYKRIL